MAGIFKDLEGVELQKGSEKITFKSIQDSGKHVGIYFSAHWCPPCRGFTPTLVEFYKSNEEKLEIIFVSMDRDQASFEGYYKEMPWCAVPFDNKDLKDKLSKGAGVSGIPHFILLNPDGSVKVQNARGNVASNPAGFPW